MSYLIPKSFFSVPSLPSFMDDEDWGMLTNAPSGLSVAEDDKNIYVEASVPGIQSNELDITFEKGVVRVVAESKKEEKENKKYFRRSQTRFSYQLALPSDVDMSKDPQTKLEHGVLHLTFSKSAHAQPRKIAVK